MPYSEQACRDASNSFGLQLGNREYKFAGSYSTKGCYTYESGIYVGIAFYGTGGTRQEVEKPLETASWPFSSKYRPFGYDCETSRTC